MIVAERKSVDEIESMIENFERILVAGCGTCVAVCPVGCISRAAEDAVPNVGSGCTGCWACYNHCPDGAISGLGCPRGAGRYAGPSPAMRELFRG